MGIDNYCMIEMLKHDLPVKVFFQIDHFTREIHDIKPMVGGFNGRELSLEPGEADFLREVIMDQIVDAADLASTYILSGLPLARA
jgi:hypothetical protein